MTPAEIEKLAERCPAEGIENLLKEPMTWLRHREDERLVREVLGFASQASQALRELSVEVAELVRVRAQIREALAIIEDGTEYEKIHVAAILREAGR